MIPDITDRTNLAYRESVALDVGRDGRRTCSARRQLTKCQPNFTELNQSPRLPIRTENSIASVFYPPLPKSMIFMELRRLEKFYPASAQPQCTLFATVRATSIPNASVIATGDIAIRKQLADSRNNLSN